VKNILHTGMKLQGAMHASAKHALMDWKG